MGFGGGGVNLYAYAGNDPINASDPSGNCPWCAVAAVGAVVGGIIGAGTSFVGQVAANNGDVAKVDYKEVAIAGAVGAAAGALAPFVATDEVAGAVLLGAANVIQLKITAWTQGKHVSKAEVITGAVTGVISGGGQGHLLREVPDRLEDTTILF